MIEKLSALFYYYIHYYAYVLFMGQLINIIELEALRSFGIEWLYDMLCEKYDVRH